VEGGRERDDFNFLFIFFIVEWLGTGGQGFFFNMLKGDGREFFFSMLEKDERVVFFLKVHRGGG
jgi:hypothetical protein